MSDHWTPAGPPYERAGSEPATSSFPAIGTTAVVAVEQRSAIDSATSILRNELENIEVTCSRFRDDSEIEGLARSNGRPTRVSALLFEALEVAIDVAERTAGAVDPTVGVAMSNIGYDRDFDELSDCDVEVEDLPRHVFGWWMIDLDSRRRTVAVPRGIRLDLGATAKALVSDRAVRRIADATGAGTLVSIGGDVAVAGAAPEGGWAIGIAVDSAAPTSMVDQVVSIEEGGLASSSTAVRKWRRAGRSYHHIIDPLSGSSAEPYWILVSATGRTCVDANAASTAAVVWGRHAPAKLESLGQPARLVRFDGCVVTVNGWPAEKVAGREPEVVGL